MTVTLNSPYVPVTINAKAVGDNPFSTHLLFMLGDNEADALDENMHIRVLCAVAPIVSPKSDTILIPVTCSHVVICGGRTECHFLQKNLSDVMVYTRSHIRDLWIEAENTGELSLPCAPGEDCILVISNEPIKIRGE